MRSFIDFRGKEVKVEQSMPAAEDPAGMEQKTGVRAAETAVKLTLADFRDSLMYDLYVRENIKSRPSFASDQSPYKKEVREFFMAEEESPQWLTDYAGFDSKQMAKMAHLEHMEDGTFVLFDYKIGIRCQETPEQSASGMTRREAGWCQQNQHGYEENCADM